MRNYILLFVLILFAGCGNTKQSKESDASDNSISGDALPYESAIKKEYYLVFDKEKTQKRNNDEPDNDNEEKPTTAYAIGGGGRSLSGKHLLNENWLCLVFPNVDFGDELSVETGKTASYELDWLEQDITVIETGKPSTNDEPFYQLAFKGDYKVSDFTWNEAKICADKAVFERITNRIRTAYKQGELEMPFKLATDTVMLKEVLIYDSGTSLYAARFVTTSYADNDGDYANELIYLLNEGTIGLAASGMSCRLPCYFTLKDKKYLWVGYHTYASAGGFLFDVDKSIVAPIYADYLFGD